MTTQHTPGPWSYDEFNGKLWVTDDTNIGTIAQLVPDSDKGNWDEDKANARLIASAPELLAALQALLSDHERMFTEAHPNSTISWGECEEVITARAAIAKATQQP